jgi:hypothetical protein
VPDVPQSSQESRLALLRPVSARMRGESVTPIEPGEQYGPWLVLSYSNDKTRTRRHVNVKCQNCGFERSMNNNSLWKARAMKSTRCIHCYKTPAHEQPKKPRKPSKYCGQCEGMSWRRPNLLGVATHPCRCGKTCRPFPVERIEASIKSSAGFDNVAETGRRLVGFCTVGEMQTRFVTR